MISLKIKKRGRPNDLPQPVDSNSHPLRYSVHDSSQLHLTILEPLSCHNLLHSEQVKFPCRIGYGNSILLEQDSQLTKFEKL